MLIGYFKRRFLFVVISKKQGKEYLTFLGKVRAKKPSLTQTGHQRIKDDFRITTTNGRGGGLLARTGSLSSHPSKQQPRSTLRCLIVLSRDNHCTRYTAPLASRRRIVLFLQCMAESVCSARAQKALL
ncbi:hypothetical protein J6590_059134 [Homalodisca vitripennis]|nr:hypothetical protein J6590_059134 [Homalodisca vitripennis]